MGVRLRGVDIDHEQLGTGRDLVWGHGLISSRADEALPPVLVDWDRLTDHVRALRYDARGHGRSGSTDEPDDYRWSALALDQLALVDHLGIERFAVGGASMGAATALHTAVIAPERVEALVLLIPPTAWETRAAQTDAYLQMADIIDRRGVELLIAAGAELPPPDPFVGDPAHLERRAARLRAVEPQRLARVFRGAATADLPSPDAVAAIGAPALILAWSGDIGHPVSTADRLAELLPRAELSVASTAAELATWTDRIVAFLAS